MARRTKISNHQVKEKKTYEQYSPNAVFVADHQKEQGYIRPLRYTCFHVSCQGTTTMTPEVASAFATNPQFHRSTYCCKCAQQFPVSQFLWSGSDTVLGT